MTGSSSSGPNLRGSSSSVPLRGNPYVGPRPFEPGEKLYGREDEISELYYLWKAERIVLLHSPSGAGKSSLIQAGLLPRIRTSFDVWGPTRVNLEPPAAVGSAVNRYLLSAMQGFEEGVPERLRRQPEALAGLRLAEYVEKRPRQRKKASKSVALLFDQFEEILTVDPLAEDAKREFFDQLGELLRNPRVWALFVLREDYLAPLDPFARQVPTHLRNRFRIDLLSLDGAREAIVNPALAGGREFPAAHRLLHDLATLKVQQPDGSFALETGRHVEPVQLQVVCFRLWDAMPEDDLSIHREDLARFGNVTEALSGYYADSVTRISGGAMAQERAIRDWFGERLITASGIRGQVLRGADDSEGLANEIIEELLDTHLVRAEKRAGATWYELAHDRLIEPVRESNAVWRVQHLSEAQRRATIWEHQGRPPGLLLRDAELAEAERWASGAEVMTAVEQRFLEESRKIQDVADRERRQARRIKNLGIAAMIGLVLALVAGGVAALKWREADRRRAQAEGLIGFLLGDLRDRLEPLGKLAILDEVGEKAMEYFASVPESNLSSEELLTRSEMLTQIGDLRMAQGNLEAALEPFRESVALSRALVERDPQDGERIFTLSQSHFWVGYIYWSQGDLSTAMEHFQAYLRIAQELVKKDPTRDDWQLELASAHTNVSLVYGARNQQPRALEHVRKGLEVMKKLTASDPTRTDWQLDLADSHTRLGMMVKAGGDLTGALEHHRAGLGIMQELVAQEPDNHIWLWLLATSHTWVGTTLVDLGDLAGAKEHYLKDLAIAEELAAADVDNKVWQADLSDIHTHIAELLANQGFFEKAFEHFHTAVSITESRVEEDPTNEDIRRDRANLHFKVGNTLAAVGALDAALHEAQKAEEILAPRVVKEPENSHLCRLLSESQLLLGRVLNEMGQSKAATIAWSRAHEVIEPIAQNSQDPDLLAPWATALLHLGRLKEAALIVEDLREMGYEEKRFTELCRVFGM